MTQPAMNSEKVLEIFKQITCVPRESGHEEKIIAFLQKFAEEHSLECKVDAAGNVLIVKPASEGCEDIPTLVLQSHSDMVCEKNAGVEHDFSKDPVKYVIEDGWMIAKETTLGADCGIGMAAQLAVLESDLRTGRIECLFTVAEETGLDGAKALQPGFITGKTLINLDSEDEGELFVGCAGGIDTTARFHYTQQEIKNDQVLMEVSIYGGIGGHSGDDINKGRANAVQLLSRFLYLCKGRYRIREISGGNKRNAIARESTAVIAVSESQSDYVKSIFNGFLEDIKAEYAQTDPDVGASLKVSHKQFSHSMTAGESEALVSALYACPHGVLEMSHDIEGLVETSSNLASIKQECPGVLRIGTSQRSSVVSSCRVAGARVEACFSLAGAEVSHEGEYPGWKPDLDSRILEVSKASYVKLFGTEPVVRAIHAGLECGLFLDIYPGLDMISFGPTLRGVHAPGERLDLDSLDKFVRLLEDVILEFK